MGQGGLDPGGLPPELVDAVAALVGDLGIHGAPVRRIGDTPDQAVALEVVDEAGHGSRGDVEHLGELAHGESPVWLVMQTHENLDTALTEAEPVRPALHAGVQLLSQDADGGQRLRARVDAPPLTAQDLTDPRVEEEAIRVGLELGVIVVGLESELTHIYVPHYYIPQETGATCIGTGPVTGRGAARRRPCVRFSWGFLGDGRPLLVRPGGSLGSRRVIAPPKGADRGRQNDHDGDRHRWPHGIDEGLREDGVGDLLDLLHHLCGYALRHREAGAALSPTDLEAGFRCLAETIDEGPLGLGR